MTETCEEMAQKYNNVQYLNLFKDDRFVEDDFFDADHLETEGAAKLTKILNEYISVDHSSFLYSHIFTYTQNQPRKRKDSIYLLGAILSRRCT